MCLKRKYDKKKQKQKHKQIREKMKDDENMKCVLNLIGDYQIKQDYIPSDDKEDYIPSYEDEF